MTIQITVVKLEPKKICPEVDRTKHPKHRKQYPPKLSISTKANRVGPMSPTQSLFVVHVLVMLTVHCGVKATPMFPFGASANDTRHTISSTLSAAVTLPTPFTYYGDSHTKIYTSEDGFLSFTKAGNIYDVDSDFDKITFPVMCLFCADFSISSTNIIWTRLSTEASDLQKVQDLARQHEVFGSSFTPTWVYVVTWDEGRYTFQPSTIGGNTIQIAVANDGTTSLVYMDFDVISWIEAFRGTGSNVNTKVGFTKGDLSTFYSFPQSKTADLANINGSSNIGVEGQFLFRVDQAPITAEPVFITTTTAAPTTTPQATTETTSTTTATTMTTTATTTATTTPPKSSSFDPNPYFIGVGVSVGVLLIVGVVALIVFRDKIMMGRSASGSGTRKVAPVPAALMNGNAIHRSTPPMDGVLALGSPFRIPRPSSSLSRPSTIRSSHLSSSPVAFSKNATSSPSSIAIGRKTPIGGSQQSFMALVV